MKNVEKHVMLSQNLLRKLNELRWLKIFSLLHQKTELSARSLK